MTQSLHLHLPLPHLRLLRHYNHYSSPNISFWVRRRQSEEGVAAVAVLGKAVVKCRHMNCPTSYRMTPILGHRPQP